MTKMEQILGLNPTESNEQTCVNPDHPNFQKIVQQVENVEHNQPDVVQISQIPNQIPSPIAMKNAGMEMNHITLPDPSGLELGELVNATQGINIPGLTNIACFNSSYFKPGTAILIKVKKQQIPSIPPVMCRNIAYDSRLKNDEYHAIIGTVSPFHMRVMIVCDGMPIDDWVSIVDVVNGDVTLKLLQTVDKFEENIEKVEVQQVLTPVDEVQPEEPPKTEIPTVSVGVSQPVKPTQVIHDVNLTPEQYQLFMRIIGKK